MRFLFIAEYSHAFEPVVVSELRGVIEPDGHSPFWDAVGNHFFEIDFPRADYLSVVNKKFIADLMPRHPIYVPLLPVEAQRVIGKVHESSKPALKNLEAEGFKFSGMVDIFDAGACVSCRRDDIRTVRQSRTAVVEQHQRSADRIADKYDRDVLRPAFRATIGPVKILDADRVCVESGAASVLNISAGSSIRHAVLRSAPESRAVSAAGARSPIHDLAHDSD